MYSANSLPHFNLKQFLKPIKLRFTRFRINMRVNFLKKAKSTIFKPPDCTETSAKNG